MSIAPADAAACSAVQPSVSRDCQMVGKRRSSAYISMTSPRRATSKSVAAAASIDCTCRSRPPDREHSAASEERRVVLYGVEAVGMDCGASDGTDGPDGPLPLSVSNGRSDMAPTGPRGCTGDRETGSGAASVTSTEESLRQ